MSGHSKWASIKRKKGAADSKRGQTFTKLANAIAIAAREGEDPGLNYKLRIAIDKARAVNMPSANIEKSIARGLGKLGTEQIQEVIYEGYGPGRSAIIVRCATDNKKRTLPEVRLAFTKNGGTMAESGAVMFQFSQKGVVQLETLDNEIASLAAIDAGATDIEEDGSSLIIYTDPKKLKEVSSNIEKAGFDIVSAELSFVPSQTVLIESEETATKLLKLIDGLEELDDVSSVYINFDIPRHILESIS